MNTHRRLLPVFPPLEDDQVDRLVRALRIGAYLSIFVALCFLPVYIGRLNFDSHRHLISVHLLILSGVLLASVCSLYFMHTGKVRLGGAIQICATWILMTLLPDLTGTPLHAVVANQVAMIIFIGPLLGWFGSVTLGVATFVFVIIQDSSYALNFASGPLLTLEPLQILIATIAL